MGIKLKGNIIKLQISIKLYIVNPKDMSKYGPSFVGDLYVL